MQQLVNEENKMKGDLQYTLGRAEKPFSHPVSERFDCTIDYKVELIPHNDISPIGLNPYTS